MRRILPLLFVVAACSTSESSSPEADVGDTQEAIVNGTDSTTAQNSVVLILHLDSISAGEETVEGCSGTLLAPNLVLTARHCVSDTDEGVICDSNGNALSGGKVISDYDPSSIFVFAGPDRPDFRSKTLQYANGSAVLNTGATTICNNDLAMIVLNQTLPNTSISPVRLSGGAQKGEAVTAIGWGISTTSEQPDVRQQRAISIADIGPSTSSQLGDSEFTTGEGACSGDSGGPVLASDGAVIGALSRGGNGTSSQGADGCLNAVNIYTAVAEHADFINAGYAKANATPFLEGQSSPGVGTPTSVPTETTVVTHHGCNASGGGFGSPELVYSLAVIFCCRRRRKSSHVAQLTLV